jgi:hypothetical protein
VVVRASRQRKWQERQLHDGKCVQCGKPRGESKRLCDECLDKDLDRRRAKRGVESPRGCYLARSM